MGVVNPIDTDFRHQSIEIDKGKSCDFDTIDFAIEIDNNWFIDCYQSLNLVPRVLSYWENPGNADQLLLIIIEKDLSHLVEVQQKMAVIWKTSLQIEIQDAADDTGLNGH